MIGGNVFKYFSAILITFACSQIASAEYYEASSDHFLVIADQNQKDVREFTERLERYHGALMVALGRDNEKPSPSNRVTVYILRSAGQVQKLAGSDSKYLQGFYLPRAGGSVAFAPRVESEGKDVSQSEQTLFHEYAHHVMHGSAAWTKPRWFSEGFAEFYSTVRFEKNGGVGIGLPANHRAYELEQAIPVSITELLDGDAYAKKKHNGYDAFYGRSWLLYHYLTLSGQRKGQMAIYQVALANGKSEIEAAQEAFGDLKVLDKELKAYQNKSTMMYALIAPEKLSVGPITMRKMREGEAAVIPIVMQSKRGVDEESAKLLLPQAQAIAAKFPDDPAVMAALSEAEHDAGNLDAAVTAADRTLVIDPQNVNGHVQKIYALSRMAETADDPKAAWAKVRKVLTALNRIEQDHPIPLIYYYDSRRGSGQDVTELAAHGLEHALELAPYDQELRWKVAQQQIDEELYAPAILTLLPLANDPHNKSDDNPATKLLEDVKKRYDEKRLELLAEQEAAASKTAAAKK
jgi:hypothetical protein